MQKNVYWSTNLALIFLIPILSFTPNLIKAAWFNFLPYTIEQPDGKIIECFASGDEYYNWLHDADGFTIIAADDGYYYYGVREGEFVVPSSYRVNSVSPASKGLTPWAKMSEAEYQKRREVYWAGTDKSIKAPHTGTLNNLVVYIRFSDQEEFTVVRSVYDGRFNNVSGVSLKNYFYEVSYEKLLIESHHYPICDLTTNLSYVDQYPRAYYMPYNATTNPTGYSGDTQRRQREHTLLRNAINAISSQVPQSLPIDGDNDGNVDNMCFVIRGNSGAWADLLWAHRWVLSTYQVFVNGKRVYDYTFQPENQNTVQTVCHEMFHSLGAPDLYHYTSDGITPAGPWDLMESGFGHMLGFMKFKYANQKWITSMPQITAPGTYTLNPLSSPTNNIYKIASPNSTTQYFVVEYRRNLGTYEASLPGSGLLVYRINTVVGNGNAQGPPDEVYIYRPGGTLTANGSVNSAHFSLNAGRTAINDATNPSSFLQNGSAGGLRISEVSATGATISFKVTFGVEAIPAFSANQTTVLPGSSVTFTDLSTNATAWHWTFAGGNPQTSTLQHPVVTYANIGSYPVKLRVSNPNFNDSITINNYIIVGTPAISVNTSAINVTINPNNTNQQVVAIANSGNTWLRYQVSQEYLSSPVIGHQQAGTILGIYPDSPPARMGMVWALGKLYVVSASTAKLSVYDTISRSITQVYDIHASPSSIAWDGEKLWIGNNIGKVFAYSPDGIPTGQSFQLPGTSIFTLTWDGQYFLANSISLSNPTLYRITAEGVIKGTFTTSLGSRITQLCWVPQHGSAKLWAVGTGKVFRLSELTNTFEATSSFNTPTSIAYSLAHDGTDFWWAATSGQLHKIDDGLFEWLFISHQDNLLSPASNTQVPVLLNSKSLQPGVYTARIKIESNDASNSTITIPVSLTVGQLIGLTDPAKESARIYSNVGKIYIQFSEPIQNTIEIFDLAGRRIKLIENFHNSNIEISGLKANNIYLVRISNHTATETRKIVIR